MKRVTSSAICLSGEVCVRNKEGTNPTNAQLHIRKTYILDKVVWTSWHHGNERIPGQDWISIGFSSISLVRIFLESGKYNARGDCFYKKLDKAKVFSGLHKIWIVVKRGIPVTYKELSSRRSLQDRPVQINM